MLMLDNLRTSGVQQAQKSGKIDFHAITGWPGEYICADGVFTEGNGDDAVERRAGIFIGPEFGTVTRANLTGAAREAAEGGFDLLIACAFSYDAHATDMDKLGVINFLKARMNADLHMADTLKKDSKGNLFVVFGEPDIEVEDAGQTKDGDEMIAIKIHGVDIFNPGHRPGTERRHRRHRLLVCRHGLQRGKLLRPPSVLPGSQQRPLPVAKSHAEGGDRRGSLEHATERHLPPVP